MSMSVSSAAAVACVFLNDTATTEIYTPSLHDALPILTGMVEKPPAGEAPSTLAIIGRYVLPPEVFAAIRETPPGRGGERSEEHTSELQSRQYLVCRLLLEKKNYQSHLPLMPPMQTSAH